MQLTKRDIEIIEYIDGFGYVMADQVFKRFKISQKRGYRRLHLLAGLKYLLHRRIFIRKPGIYQAGSKGLALICDDPEHPPRPAAIRPATMEHDLLLVDLAQEVMEKYGGTWKTERQIWQERGFVPVEAKMHVPDGILTLQNQKIAVELELTAKSSQRLEKILKGYARATEFNEVWYFMKSPAAAEKIRELARKMPFVKVFMLLEVIDGGKKCKYTRSWS